MKIFPIARYGQTADPFDMMSTFDNIFNSYFNTLPARERTSTTTAVNTVPRANVVKNEEGYTIELAAPGFSRDEFIIDVENNTLSISVSTEDGPEYTSNIQMREFRFSSFSRSWTLPEGSNVDQIVASYDAGILYVNIPVQGTKETKRSITVQ